jgi:hypothetical protein
MDATRTNQKGKGLGSCNSVEENGGGRDKEDSKPSALVMGASSARIGSDLDQADVQEEATTHGEIPYGWIRAKLEPDC